MLHAEFCQTLTVVFYQTYRVEEIVVIVQLTMTKQDCAHGRTGAKAACKSHGCQLSVQQTESSFRLCM